MYSQLLPKPNIIDEKNSHNNVQCVNFPSKRSITIVYNGEDIMIKRNLKKRKSITMCPNCDSFYTEYLGEDYCDYITYEFYF